MKKILIVGHGNIGKFLFEEGKKVFDNRLFFTDLIDHEHPDFIKFDKILNEDFSLIVNCSPMKDKNFVESLIEKNISYIDFNEDLNWAREIDDLYKTYGNVKNCSVVCGCGISPGFISIYAAKLARQNPWIRNFRVYVGLLPQLPTNELYYDFFWSIDGLIDEYIGEGEIVEEGKLKKVKALTGKQLIEIDNRKFEARYINGGLHFPEKFAEKFNIKNVDYKTLRYPDHYEFFYKLIHVHSEKPKDELKYFLKKVLEPLYRKKPVSKDILYIVYEFDNYGNEIDGFGSHKTNKRKSYKEEIIIKGTNESSAIQRATAFPALAICELIDSGKLQNGFVYQHEIIFEDFSSTVFGSKIIEEIGGN